MAWADAKTKIVTVLEGISGIVRVYANPVESVADLPCIIVYPPALRLVRGMSQRRKEYTVRLRLLVRDADLATAAGELDAFRELTVDAFDNALTLSGTATVIDGPNAEEAGRFPYGGHEYVGIDFLLTVTLKEAKAFAG